MISLEVACPKLKTVSGDELFHLSRAGDHEPSLASLRKAQTPTEAWLARVVLDYNQLTRISCAYGGPFSLKHLDEKRDYGGGGGIRCEVCSTSEQRCDLCAQKTFSMRLFDVFVPDATQEQKNDALQSLERILKPATAFEIVPDGYYDAKREEALARQVAASEKLLSAQTPSVLLSKKNQNMETNRLMICGSDVLVGDELPLDRKERERFFSLLSVLYSNTPFSFGSKSQLSLWHASMMLGFWGGFALTSAYHGTLEKKLVRVPEEDDAYPEALCGTWKTCYYCCLRWQYIKMARLMLSDDAEFRTERKMIVQIVNHTIEHRPLIQTSVHKETRTQMVLHELDNRRAKESINLQKTLQFAQIAHKKKLAEQVERAKASGAARVIASAAVEEAVVVVGDKRKANRSEEKEKEPTTTTTTTPSPPKKQKRVIAKISGADLGHCDDITDEERRGVAETLTRRKSEELLAKSKEHADAQEEMYLLHKKAIVSATRAIVKQHSVKMVNLLDDASSLSSPDFKRALIKILDKKEEEKECMTIKQWSALRSVFFRELFIEWFKYVDSGCTSEISIAKFDAYLSDVNKLLDDSKKKTDTGGGDAISKVIADQLKIGEHDAMSIYCVFAESLRRRDANLEELKATKEDREILSRLTTFVSWGNKFVKTKFGMAGVFRRRVLANLCALPVSEFSLANVAFDFMHMSSVEAADTEADDDDNTDTDADADAE